MIFQFKKLFSMPEEGASERSIIVYQKHEWTFSTTKDGLSGYVSSYRKRLIIDLWICIIFFDWVTKEPIK